MLTEKGNIVISNKPANATEDYEGLRKTGLGYIQQFSGKVWTDYNVHDPGITIFELLCYALTDLSYRTSFSVADLLTDPRAKGPRPEDFFTARQILTTHPVTINDYRKLILDSIPGIRNVWFETLDDTEYIPAIYFDKNDKTTSFSNSNVIHQYEALKLKGLYVVKIEAEDYETINGHHPHFLKTLAKFRNKDSVITDIEATPEEYKSCLTNFAKHVLLGNRNLCEDFEIVKVADEELVAVCADIELHRNADADEAFKKINQVLYNYINPSLKFYSFKELLEKGKRTEEIFNGPATTRGFIDEDELNAHGHREVLYVSDIINLLIEREKIPEILQIKSIHLSSYKKKEDGSFEILQDAQKYCLHLQDKANAVFQFVLDADEQDKNKIFNHIRFSKGPIYFSPKRDPHYINHSFIRYPHLPKDFEKDLLLPPGKNRNLLNYYSVQNDFPLCYYTGMDGIPNTETTLRKAQRLQTKAFLLFFDQLLADYLAQLNNLKNVFTWNGNDKSPGLVPFQLNEKIIKDLRKLVVSEHAADDSISDEEFFKKTYKDYSKQIESARQQKRRRNLLLDHLLARFNELFVDYTVFKFRQNKQGDFFGSPETEETINDKIQFLKSYPIISSRRSHAFKYTKGMYGVKNISGLQLRIQKMMGLATSQNRRLASATNNINHKTLLQKMSAKPYQPPKPEDKVEIRDTRFESFDKAFGFHVLEHILLRPQHNQDITPLTSPMPLCGDGTNNQHADCLLPDNYSMTMTVVLPGWLAISNHMDFRAFTENLVRMEAPAHVAVKICWIDPAAMFLFEKTTEEYFKIMAKLKKPGVSPKKTDIKKLHTALTDVYIMIGLLKNIYLPSRLDECANIDYNKDTDKINVPLILNYSALGDDGENEWFVFKKK